MKDFTIKDYSWDADGDVQLTIKGLKTIDMRTHIELEAIIKDHLNELKARRRI